MAGPSGLQPHSDNDEVSDTSDDESFTDDSDEDSDTDSGITYSLDKYPRPKKGVKLREVPKVAEPPTQEPPPSDVINKIYEGGFLHLLERIFVQLPLRSVLACNQVTFSQPFIWGRPIMTSRNFDTQPTYPQLPRLLVISKIRHFPLAVTSFREYHFKS